MNVDRPQEAATGLLTLAADRGDQTARRGGLEGFAPQAVPGADVAVLDSEPRTVSSHDMFGDAPCTVVFRRGHGRSGLREAGPVEAVAGRQSVAPVRLPRHTGSVRAPGTAGNLVGASGQADCLATLGPGLLPFRRHVLHRVGGPAGPVECAFAPPFLPAGFLERGELDVGELDTTGLYRAVSGVERARERDDGQVGDVPVDAPDPVQAGRGLAAGSGFRGRVPAGEDHQVRLVRPPAGC
ncbi:hypothetical protein ABZV80_38850 [Streptomyces sp. NPDC005132]|uniref:hypothetical protein n=1 Tax=Streptomyces sp. NPDC005132 TaxID=3154294 RepID=UPI0033BBC66C